LGAPLAIERRMVSKQSITHWIQGAKAGDEHAVQKLWERYHARLVNLARRKLDGCRRCVADEEDAALAAFNSFCLKARAGRFPHLADRYGLWRLLVRITANKVIDQIKWERRARRGKPGQLLAGGAPSDGDLLANVVGDEPTPEFAASFAEELERLLAGLGETLRQVVVWKMEGYTSPEIAARLGCTERTVARKLDLIRNLLAGRCKS
jgi:DNA-directed RNA polymerase specialized sigma24 family protein